MRAWILKSTLRRGSIIHYYTERDIQIILQRKVDTAALCELEEYFKKTFGIESCNIERKEYDNFSFL